MGLTDKLDLLMKERNINKADLARESGVPYTTIDGFYKKGSENAKLSTLKKLCTYFNCTLDYLADDDVGDQPTTIAAHKDGENFTPDELAKIEEYKKLLLAARPKD
jgi:transcriptional regulator with XRE-family HTH domain